MAAGHTDVIVVGAGFAGLYAHYRLCGLGLSALGFEAAPDVGGTWYWNAYPGARCDVESLDYCYSFSPELLDDWRWSERYATQPEILRYAHHVAERFDLRRDVTFATRVVAARFDRDAALWTVETDKGDRATARFLVAAVGPLSVAKLPDFPGLEDFVGRWVMTSAWPHEPVDMADKHVALIGTGSSGIQAIPVIAEQAARLTVFQRTPNFSLPARNGPPDPAYEALARSDYAAHIQRNRASRGGVQPKYTAQPGAIEVDEAARLARYEEAWDLGGTRMQAAFRDLMSDVAANDTAADFVRGKIRAIVVDPTVAQRLSPYDHPLGTKRICLDTDYYATFNRPNVTLVDIRSEPIERIATDGIVTAAGLYPADLIVFATGFDAMTGPLLAMNIEGAGGHRLADAWADGPATYLGLMVAGFPNLFLVNGPGSPSVLCNMLVAIEQHVDWIVDAIAHLRETGRSRIEALSEAQAAWVDEVRMVADRTLYPLANSWYNGDNVPGKPRVFLPYVGGFDTYVRRCAEIVSQGYAGFRLSPA